MATREGLRSALTAPAPAASPGGRGIGRQVVLLLRKQLVLKRRAWRWTLLEVVFPLQPILFLWLIFKLGDGLLPFERKVTEAASSAPLSLLNASAPGLLGFMHLGGSIGSSPASAAAGGGDAAAAAAAYAVFCGAYDALLAWPGYESLVEQVAAQASGAGSVTCDADAGSAECRGFAQFAGQLGVTVPGGCRWYESAGGWVPFADAMPGKQAGGPPGLYLGVELGASSLRLRYEELLLADDANAEPAEQNAARSGLLAMQAAASALLMLHDTCPAEMEACGRECVAAAAGLAAATFGPSTGQLGAKCRQNPSAPACLLQLMEAMPADATALLVCLLPQWRGTRGSHWRTRSDSSCSSSPSARASSW